MKLGGRKVGRLGSWDGEKVRNRMKEGEKMRRSEDERQGVRCMAEGGKLKDLSSKLKAERSKGRKKRR
jgi:hypothetical protein